MLGIRHSNIYFQFNNVLFNERNIFSNFIYYSSSISFPNSRNMMNGILGKICTLRKEGNATIRVITTAQLFPIGGLRLKCRDSLGVDFFGAPLRIASSHRSRFFLWRISGLWRRRRQLPHSFLYICLQVGQIKVITHKSNLPKPSWSR